MGGIKEKTIAARRSNVHCLVFPQGNKRDFDELPDYLKDGLEASGCPDVPCCIRPVHEVYLVRTLLAPGSQMSSHPHLAAMADDRKVTAVMGAYGGISCYDPWTRGWRWPCDRDNSYSGHRSDHC